ncbi:MAG TPA: glycosyl hydrolase [Candidatus Angelobacter sp.]|nr:glycosyl hydrolase [Candidatus Angelobacter sp.]
MHSAYVQPSSRIQSSVFKALCLIPVLALSLQAQTVNVGAGSYTTTLPAGAAAPSSQIFNTVGGPKPTHRFWAAKNWYADNIVNGAVTFGGGGGGPFNMFPQPLGMQTTGSGLLMGFDATLNNGGTFFNQPFEGDLTIGVAGLNAASVPVSGYTDWTVDFNFGPMTARVGRGMPFVYVTTNGSNPTVTFAGQPTVFANNGNILGVSIANNNYGLFCPSGGSWSGIGTTVLTCNLPGGRHYFSLALLPNQAALSTYSQFAFSFPTNTQVTWNYNPSTSQVTTTYTVTTQAQEGTQTGFLMALYPHQYTALQSGSINTNFTYPSSRGTLEVLEGVSFTTVNTFQGVLPFLPSTGNFNNTTLTSFINTVANEANHFAVSQSGGGTNTYDIGKDLARVAHLLPIAKVAGDTTALNSLQASLQNELQNWFNGAANNQSTNVFYYNSNWGTLIGYPAAFGSDIALNDHHFHYGYWIHSSAILGLFNPSWIQSNNWGGMVDLLARDIAAPVRNDALFPFLRYFDVYGGHSWASGQAPFGDGENQESSSEAVNAWTGLILFAVETGNTQLRDAAIWMYTQETNSIFDYWFNDGRVATFPAGFSRVEIANVFDGKGDTGTFFSGQIELEHGIEFLPFHGGSLYLGRDPAYVQRNLAEVTSIDPNAFAAGSTNWPDIMEEFEALEDPATALNQFNNTSFVFDGESKANEYYWITNLQALGRVDETVTANTPLYRVFKTAGGVRTHVAFNAGTASITVNFSDGANFTAPAGSMVSEFGTVSLGNGGSQSPSASLSANSLTFGSQNVGTTSASQTLTLTNHGPGGLTISSVAVTGDFSQTNNCGTSLAANASCSISVSFKPTATGARTGTLTVTDNASNSPQTAALSGTGTSGAPSAPSNLSATAVSSSQINLTWTASSTSGVTYNVYRSTSSGFAISPGTRIATGISGTSFSNTGLSASTTFFYLVTATNSNGESAASNQASATTQSGGGTVNGPVSINAGGGASGTFVADAGFSGGSAVSTTAAIDVGLIPAPVPPQAVYQTGRSGVSTYTIGGLTAGSSHQVQLHFAEIVFTAARQRAFNIVINGTTVLSNFDIVANAGVPNKAIEENFAATANSSGQIVIQFTTGSTGTPLINGIVVQ